MLGGVINSRFFNLLKLHSLAGLSRFESRLTNFTFARLEKDLSPQVLALIWSLTGLSRIPRNWDNFKVEFSNISILNKFFVDFRSTWTRKSESSLYKAWKIVSISDFVKIDFQAWKILIWPSLKWTVIEKVDGQKTWNGRSLKVYGSAILRREDFWT